MKLFQPFRYFWPISLLLGGLPALSTSVWAAPSATVLGIQGTYFTLNGKPTFLLGFSYYGALGAPREFVAEDLDDFQRLGFNWLRVWATWTSSDEDVSAVDRSGQARDLYLQRLKRLVADCDRRGLVVDVTLTRGAAHLPGLISHQQAVQTVVAALKGHRNWYLDLANERDVRDERFVPVKELRILSDLARRLDPKLLLTASFGGHDLGRDDIHDALQVARLDFLCPHRPRTPGSPGQTEARTRSCLAVMAETGLSAPIDYQEPFRRGYERWAPAAEDFLTDLRGAVAGGAAGWCFHNGQQRDTIDHQPRRSFDLRQRRLFDQLDSVEHKFAVEAKSVIEAGGKGNAK